MNARVKATPVCCGCGEEPGTYDHDGFDLCGACLDEVLAEPLDPEQQYNDQWQFERDHAADRGGPV